MKSIVKKNGRYYQVFTVQGGRRKIYSPLGDSLAKARAQLKARTALTRDAWLWIKPRPVDEAAIHRAARAFRAADTRRFNASKTIALVTDAPERFRPLPDGGLNPTAGMLTHNGFSFATVSTAELEQGRLQAFQVAVFPGGFGYFPSACGAARIREFVEAGGGFIGVCAGAFLPLRPCFGIRGAGLGLLDAEYEYFREKGVALVRFNPADPLARGLRSTNPGIVYALYKPPAKTRRHTILISMLRGNGPLIRARGATRVSGYYDGSQPYAAVVHGRCGRGRIVVFSAHPDTPASQIAQYASDQDALENFKLSKNAVLYAGGIA